MRGILVKPLAWLYTMHLPSPLPMKDLKWFVDRQAWFVYVIFRICFWQEHTTTIFWSRCKKCVLLALLHDIIYRICLILWLILCTMGAFFGHHSSVVFTPVAHVHVSRCQTACWRSTRAAVLSCVGPASMFAWTQPRQLGWLNRCNWGYARREAARRCTGKRGEAMALQVWKKWRFVEIYIWIFGQTNAWKNCVGCLDLGWYLPSW